MMPPFDLRLMDHPPARYVRSDRYAVPARRGTVGKILNALLTRIQGIAAGRQVSSRTT
jgi:hypothetical protein